MIAPLEVICRTILGALVASVAEAALLGTFAGLVIALSRTSATTRHAVWWLALAGAAALPFASIASSLARVEHRTAATAFGSHSLERETSRGVRDGIPGGAILSAAGPSADGVARAVVSYPHAAETAVAIWLLLAGCGATSLAYGLVSLRRVKRRAIPLDEAFVRRLRRFRHASRNGRSVDIRVSTEIDVPVAVGFRSPTILLPLWLVESDSLGDVAGLDAIALHEYAHLERYDDWTNLAERALVAVFWFDPIVAFFTRRIALEREIACDDAVIARTGRAHRYATSLWKLVEATHLPARRVVAPGALFNARQITVRIERLLDSQRNALPRLAPLGALATAIVAIAFVVVQAVRAPAIALDDRVALRTHETPRAQPSPMPLPTLAARATSVRLHRVPVEATPQAIARAISSVVGADSHAVVETTVRRHATGPDSYADEIGIEVAQNVSHASRASHADSIGPGCRGCDLHGADLRGRNLRNVRWVGVDVHDADLRDADLRGARFVGVDFDGARFDGADLRGARFSGCSVTEAQLRNADTRGASLDDVGDASTGEFIAERLDRLKHSS